MCVIKLHAFIYFLRPPPLSGTVRILSFSVPPPPPTSMTMSLVWRIPLVLPHPRKDPNPMLGKF